MCKRKILISILIATAVVLLSAVLIIKHMKLSKQDEHRRKSRLRNLHSEVVFYTQPFPSLYEIFCHSTLSIDDFIFYLPSENYDRYIEKFTKHKSEETFNKIIQYRFQEDEKCNWYIEELNSGKGKFYRIKADGEIMEIDEKNR